MSLEVLKVVAFAFFFAAFVALAVWLAFTDRDRFARQARLPLHDEKAGSRRP
jgi:hypothetical protein